MAGYKPGAAIFGGLGRMGKPGPAVKPLVGAPKSTTIWQLKQQQGHPFGSSSPTGPAGPSAPTGPKPFVGPGPDMRWADSTYNDTVSGIGTNLSNTQIALRNAGINLGTDYGISGTFDPTSQTTLDPSTLKIDDTSNPFSRAALLRQAYTQSARGDGNRMAAQGQLYSGAYQNAQDADQANFTAGQHGLLSDFADKYGGLVQQSLGAVGTAGDQGIAAQAAAIGRHANDAPLAPPSVPNFPSTGGKAAGSTGTGFQDFTKAQAKQAGITGTVRDGKIVFLDSKGNIIPGAVGYVQGKTAGVRVPKGAS